MRHPHVHARNLQAAGKDVADHAFLSNGAATMPGLSMTTNLLAPGRAVRITASESGQASPCPEAGPSSIGNRQMPLLARTTGTQTEPTGCDN